MRFYRSELDRSRVKAALRDENYTWVSESQDFTKVQGLGFHKNREKAVSGEITLFKAEFFSYLV